MGEKVVGLHEPVTYEREVREDVVRVLEEVLEKARSGEVIGVALAETYWDGGGGNEIEGVVVYSTVGAVEEVKLACLGILNGG